MRAIERAAIETGATTGHALMERAGGAVVSALWQQWPHLAAASHRAVVLCGPGNNGGDGFVIARLLREWGWAVEVFLYGDPAGLPPDARMNCERWQRMGPVGRLEDAPRGCGQADLFVDALFGTGLGRPLEGAALDWVAAHGRAPGAGAQTVAVDLPSGLCSDSGRELGGAGRSVLAGLTVSFHAAKLGHYLDAGPARCGRLVVADIGLAGAAACEGDRAVLAAPDRASLAKAGRAHKYGHGHALVLGGGAGRGGAARLAARGALRIGAGLVTVAPTPGALQENAARLDAVMLRAIDGADELEDLLEDARIGALCLGPGLGIERARALVPAALPGRRRDKSRPAGLDAKDKTRGAALDARDKSRPAVLDADALSAFAQAPEALFERLHEGCVLTPHDGEFARLFPDIADKLAAPAERGPAFSRVDAARVAAARAGCVVLLKGADTVIASPDGRCAVNAAAYERAAPWLATAGAGDVLAGFITGLLARGFEPMAAAETAAWLHVGCARAFGPGLIAEDLPEMLPRVLAELGA